MAQNRKPPAYMEYASDMLAKREYRLLSLAARGLLQTMRYECWVNKSLPSDPGDLARIVGFPRDEIAALLPAVMFAFHDDGKNIVCPELENYRAHRAEIRAAQREGGKNGAAITNKKRSTKSATLSAHPSATLSAHPSATPSGPDMSRNEPNRNEQNSLSVSDEFVSDYEEFETSAAAYRRASEGD
jgi:uncharacterized protein YdaU (DUF1376 family)